MSKKNKKSDEKNVSSNFKLISTSSGVRVSQACDRCRIKKIKCDGQSPCRNCQKVSVECKTSDRLSRKSFPKGFTLFLEAKVKELEDENRELREKLGDNNDAPPFEPVENKHLVSTADTSNITTVNTTPTPSTIPTTTTTSNDKVLFQTNNQSVPINNPIDQIFNLDDKGIIIGNDNLNFESQFNHLLINLNLPFLKITNSHNYLLDDPDSYLYHPSYTKSNKFHNRDLDLIYNPLTGKNTETGLRNELPTDVYDLFIKLINNFKKIFKSKREMDNQIVLFFLHYNIFIPIFDYNEFMESYNAFHTMYPFIFTYDDSSINGFNLSNTNDYQIVNNYLMTIIQIYAMILINNPTLNLNLLLNHTDPHYSINRDKSIIKSLYDFLPYFNGFHISIGQLQTYLLFLYYSLLTNNKEKSLILSSLVNAFIGILGINLNSKNLFFNDLALKQQQRRNRVKIFWVFKILLKCFNLKFGFKPSLNTTVINPVTIDRYFQLTPEKLSSLLDDNDDLFNTLLKPSIEFLNLMNIIIPSSFSPNYYQYLKQDRKKKDKDKDKDKEKDHHHHHHHHTTPHRLDLILNEDDGEGNDGNLNYNYHQFLIIDKNLSAWRKSLQNKKTQLTLLMELGLPNLINIVENDLYFDMNCDALSREGLINYYLTGLPDIHTASHLIKLQLNFHYILIRSTNYLNFIVDRELTFEYYREISLLSMEVLQFFLLIFEHVSKAEEKINEPKVPSNSIVMESLGLDVDEDGFVINDFSVKRRKLDSNNKATNQLKKLVKEIPISPFNTMLNGLSLCIINLKKSIILQMLYLLICQMKFIKRPQGWERMDESFDLLNKTVDLFIRLFINYKPGTSKKVHEDKLYKKLVNDELKDDILRHHQYGSDDEEEEEEDDDDQFNGAKKRLPGYYKSIDWDDEDLDEDLKYLKILKFVKYKSNDSLQKFRKKQKLDNNTNTNGNGSGNGNGIPQPTSVTHHHHLHHHSQPQTETDIAVPQLPIQHSSSVSPPQPPPPAPAPVIMADATNLSNDPKSNLPLPQYYNPYQPMPPIFGNEDKDRGAAHDLMNLRRGSSQGKLYPPPSSQSPQY